MSAHAAPLLRRALMIARNLGTRSAAGFLRNRDVTFEEAHFMLLGYGPRR